MRFRLLRRNAVAFLCVSVAVGTLFLSALVLIRPGSDARVAPRPGTPGPPGAGLDFTSLSALTRSVYSANYRQVVHNAEKFPGDPELVVVIQVHKRTDYLRLLIWSLQKAAEVQDLLLVFSHDFFSEEIDAIVREVTFCKALQIYFPFSTQLYPGVFPGQGPRDCPRNMSPASAVKAGCLNARHPDSYGHYREAQVTQAKHHWWWTLHFVWERVRALQGYGGFVVFLEEDNYVLPDFFHFYKLAAEFRSRRCPDCDLLALGNHNSPEDFSKLTDKVVTSGWMSAQHNMGMAISREVYYKLMGCSDDFCTYDDYNWDWTLQHLSGTCISKPLKVLAAEGSRVVHTGDCGLHQEGSCQPEKVWQKVESLLRVVKSSLFPESLVLSAAKEVEHKPHIKNGGWGDVRDHTLCKNYAKRL